LKTFRLGKKKKNVKPGNQSDYHLILFTSKYIKIKNFNFLKIIFNISKSK
jgi:hypothetical protein